jgi:hypothetical protein
VSGLVHLNGRVYDPLLARMTSADPTRSDRYRSTECARMEPVFL